MADMIKFYRGLASNLPTTGADGALYITTDEGAIYYGTGTGMKRLGDFVQVDDVKALPEQAHQSCLYYCVAENILAKWNGTEWKQINKQPTAEEMKTLLGLGSAAYTDATDYDAAGSAAVVREYVGDIPNDENGDPIAASVIAYINKKTDGIATSGNLEALGARVTTAEGEIDALQEASAKHVEKEEGKSLIADTEITRLAGMSDGANKVEASTNGKIKIDGVDTVVYTHPDKHAITEVDGLETALAGKQDVIPENTYDAYGASAQALADAKADATTKDEQVLVDAKAYVDNADKFVVDMLTVNSHGGVAAGADLNGLTTHEILKKILYPYVQPSLGTATATPNGGTYEKGTVKTITQVKITVTKKSEAITSVALYNGSTLIEEKTGDAVKAGGTFTFSNLSVEVPTNGNQLTVKVTDAANKTYEAKTSAMSFVYPYYMGSVAAGTTIDESVIESLTKKIEGKGNKSHSFDLSDSNIVFAYLKSHGALKSIIDPNGYETISGYNRSEVSVTGLDGTAQTYYVYVSKDSATSTGFTVNFKY